MPRQVNLAICPVETPFADKTSIQGRAPQLSCYRRTPFWEVRLLMGAWLALVRSRPDNQRPTGSVRAFCFTSHADVSSSPLSGCAVLSRKIHRLRRPSALLNVRERSMCARSIRSLVRACHSSPVSDRTSTELRSQISLSSFTCGSVSSATSSAKRPLRRYLYLSENVR